MAQPQPGEQPPGGTQPAPKARRSRSRAPEWMSRPPVLLAGLGCVLVLELAAFFGLGWIWWLVGNAVLAAVIWWALLAWRRKGKGKGGFLGQLLDRAFGGRGGSAGGGRKGGGKRGGRGGSLSRMLGHGPGGQGRGGRLGKLLGGRGGGKSGPGRSSSGRGGPLGKLLGGRGGGKLGKSTHRGTGLGKLLGSKKASGSRSGKLGKGSGSWWPFTNPLGGSASGRRSGEGKRGGGGGSGGLGSLFGRGGGSGGGGKGRKSGKGGKSRSKDRADLNHFLNDDFRDVFGRRRVRGDSDDGGGDDDWDSDDGDGEQEPAEDQQPAVADATETEPADETAATFTTDGGTVTAKNQIYTPGIKLQDYARRSVPAMVKAAEASKSATQKLLAHLEKISKEIGQAANQADTEMPMRKPAVAEIQTLHRQIEAATAQIEDAAKKLIQAHAQAQTIRPQIERHNAHDMERADGKRGFNRKTEAAADVEGLES